MGRPSRVLKKGRLKRGDEGSCSPRGRGRFMRGRNERQATMLVGVTAEELVPARHPIRRIREVVDRLLDELGPVFSAMYAERGRPSIPPEHLLKSTLLMALYSIRSERQ